MIAHIWEGVYQSFDEVPSAGQGHSGGAWVTNSLAKVRELQTLMERKGLVPPVPAYNASLLPFLAAIWQKEHEEVRILDFGGGLGTTFLHVAAGLPVPEAIQYHVIETEAVCRAGVQLFSDEKRLRFDWQLPPNKTGFDIVHLGSSLQYIDDWKKLLSSLAAYHPYYIMLTDLPAGDIPTYVTAQHYYGSNIPARFFNLGEIEEAMRSESFSLVFRSRFLGTYLGKVQPVPQDNFPRELRIGDTCSLVFRNEGQFAGKRGLMTR